MKKFLIHSFLLLTNNEDAKAPGIQTSSGAFNFLPHREQEEPKNEFNPYKFQHFEELSLCQVLLHQQNPQECHRAPHKLPKSARKRCRLRQKAFQTAFRGRQKLLMVLVW
jgi:hypothetical protein